MAEPEVVIVGGGIAGASLATVLARAGADIVMLERQTSYRDHVRGELVWPWGIAITISLDLEAVWVAAGASRATTFESHDEGRGPHREAVTGPEGVVGSLNLGHPEACAAIAAAAEEAGAGVLSGVRDVIVTPGVSPTVEYVHAGRRVEARPRLVVGADGRTSSVRRQAGIPLEIDEPAHLVAGLLTEEIDGQDLDADITAREGDLLFLTFPQRDDRARLYHCFPTSQRDRFAGPDAATRFLAACALDCLPDWKRRSRARAAGPCGTFPASDARAATPVAPGVVLVGDAAGYENPLLGQGLSMALRDVLDVSTALIRGPEWTPESFAAYAADRSRRHHLAMLATRIEVWINDGYAPQDPATRASRRALVHGDALLRRLDATIWNGFDAIHDVDEASVAERLVG